MNSTTVKGFISKLNGFLFICVRRIFNKLKINTLTWFYMIWVSLSSSMVVCRFGACVTMRECCTIFNTFSEKGHVHPQRYPRSITVTWLTSQSAKVCNYVYLPPCLSHLCYVWDENQCHYLAAG